MNNRRYYSFERNNYFYGKLLTSRDFEDEQNYMNNKRRLVNRVLHGSGVVYGLDVVPVDESSIVIQSGMALDASGREIVVQNTQVVKLSTVRGYRDLKTSSACLGIAYAEEKTEPVYAVMKKDADAAEHQYNHLKEGYELFLMDSRDCVRESRREDAFITQKVLYEDDDWCVTQYLPAFTVPGMAVKGRTRIVKTSRMPFVGTFTCRVTVDGMEPAELEIRADNVSQEYGEVLMLEQTFRPEEYVFGNGELNVRFGEITVQKSGVKEGAPEVTMTVAPVYGTALDYVQENSYRGNLDVDLDQKYDEKLWIARIRLIRSEHHSIIDQVERCPFDQYVYNSVQLMILEKLEEYLIPENQAGAVQPARIQGSTEAGSASGPAGRRANSSGVFEMSLGTGGEVGKVYFSEEIMHGLGNGPVYVDIGIEYISRDTEASGDRESIILGDGSIFESDATVTDEKIFQVDQAVKILPARGTFIVGVRPRVKMGRIGLRIRWYAFKPEDLEQRVYDRGEQKGCIMIQPDTIVLPPKGSVHIAPVFINMPEQALTFTLLDPEGGKIDNTGLYTAPAQEGVYEIRAEVLGDPKIFTHAFVIVSQKKTEE